MELFIQVLNTMFLLATAIIATNFICHKIDNLGQTIDSAVYEIRADMADLEDRIVDVVRV